MKKQKVKIGFKDYLNLRDVGFLELTFALTPMLSGYSLGRYPLSVLMWVFLLGVVVYQGKINRFKVYKPLLYLFVYWLIHDLMIMIVDNVNIFLFISQIIYFLAVFVLYPVMDLKKLKGSLNWVALLSIAGLLFQWQDILRGGMVHPLVIPGLTMPEVRLSILSLRPSSFFMEPASFVAFMICPLFFALVDKKYYWVVSIILSIFLTTSTTGLVLSFIMLGVSVLSTRRAKIWTWVASIVIGTSLYIALTNLEIFEVGLVKFENTEVSSNVRLSQGIYVVKTMQPSEYIFGVPYSAAYNYCISGRAPDVEFYGEAVFMPTFWLMILLYGIVGLALYLNVYFQILRKNQETLILVIALFAVLFSSGYSIHGPYIFSLICLLVFAKYYYKNMYSN